MYLRSKQASIMKTVHFRCWSWFTSIAGILFGILRYIKNLVFKKPKKNEEAVHATTKDPTPVTIFVDENTDTSQGNMYPRASRMVCIIFNLSSKIRVFIFMACNDVIKNLNLQIFGEKCLHNVNNHILKYLTFQVDTPKKAKVIDV